MFFYASKLVWMLLAPSNLLILAAALGVALSFTRFMRAGRVLAALGVVGLLLAGFGPAGRTLARPLEDRFARPASLGDVAGIIVLGGAIGASRGEVTFNASASRMTEAIDLARRFPAARLAFTGGSASLLGQDEMTEAEAARRVFVSVGIEPGRLILEDKSRNTHENAVLLKPLLGQKPGERWLLVTSAAHMPRSVGIFREAGVAVTPYPVDYVTSGTRRDFLHVNREFSQGLTRTDQAAREWVGLIAYRLAGRTDALFPGPR